MTPSQRPRKRGEDLAALHPALFEQRREEWLHEKERPFQRRAYMVQLVIFVGLLVIWQFPVFNPIKLLVVLFHEMSHVFLAYVTGGVVFGVAIDPGGAGVTLGMGGNRVLILAAGYLGSFAIGAILYGLSAVWRAGQVWIVLTIFSLCSMLMGWMNNFTSVFGTGTLVLIVLAGMFLRDRAKQVLLRVIGTASCLYPVIDVVGELWGREMGGFAIRGQYVGSDVMQMGTLLGVPWGILGIAWTLVGLGLLAFLVTWSIHLEARNKVKGELVLRKRKKEREKQARAARPYNPNDPSTVPEYTIK